MRHRCSGIIDPTLRSSSLESGVTIGGQAALQTATKPTKRTDRSALQLGDRWLDTSTGLIWIWNAAQGIWISQSMFIMCSGAGLGVNAYSWGTFPRLVSSSIAVYFKDISVSFFVSTTNNASNYYSLHWYSATQSNSYTPIWSFSTASYAAGTWTTYKYFIDFYEGYSSFPPYAYKFDAVATGAPGAIQSSMSVTYQLMYP